MRSEPSSSRSTGRWWWSATCCRRWRRSSSAVCATRPLLACKASAAFHPQLVRRCAALWVLPLSLTKQKIVSKSRRKNWPSLKRSCWERSKIHIRQRITSFPEAKLKNVVRFFRTKACSLSLTAFGIRRLFKQNDEVFLLWFINAAAQHTYPVTTSRPSENIINSITYNGERKAYIQLLWMWY